MASDYPVRETYRGVTKAEADYSRDYVAHSYDRTVFGKQQDVYAVSDLIKVTVSSEPPQTIMWIGDLEALKWNHTSGTRRLLSLARQIQTEIDREEAKRRPYPPVTYNADGRKKPVKKHWIILGNVNSGVCKKFEVKEEAIEEAKRLAHLNQGDTIVIYEAIGVTKRPVPDIEIVKL